MKTEPLAPARKARWIEVPARERIAIGLILLAALALRLWHVGFGLPALNDPDEPLFMMASLDMLREHRLNPEWFGHPATTLFYVLAIIFLLVGLAGLALGQWSGVSGYVAAVFYDPGIAALPMRLFIVLCGLATIYLTYRIGKRTVGARAGLVGALLLACNSLHIEWSQVIRTDMMATVFMLWSTLRAISIAEEGRGRDHVLAGVAAGLACATKWPAVVVLANAAGATLLRAMRRRTEIGWLPVAPLVAVITLFLVSPYLLLDYPTVLHDLHGEARPFHLGQTGTGFGGNLIWYARLPLADSFSIAGMVLAAVGLLIVLRRHRSFAVAVLPGAAVFLCAIAAQSLVWERWIVPLLPFVALLAAIAIDAGAALFQRPRHAYAAAAVLTALAVVPMAATALAEERMRANDTRQVASAWLRTHVPDDRSILVEHAAFDMLHRHGALLFPLGSAGCVDMRQALGAHPSFQNVDHKRNGRAIVDIGHVDPARLPSCAADVMVFSHYARYQAEAFRFQPQLAIYRTLMRNGRLVERIEPIPGMRGGPVIDIIATRPDAVGR